MTGDSSHSRVSLVHGSVWQELSGVWHTVWRHFPVALPRTHHTSGPYVYSWILPCPIARTVHTREADLIPGNKKHTWRLPRSVIGTLNFGKLYSPYIFKKKVFRPWYVYLYSTTVYINLQISKTKQCSNKKTDLRTPKQNKQKKTRNEHSKCLQTFQPNTCKSLL